MAALRLIVGGYDDPADVADAESRALARAVEDMRGWIDSLPTESEWRWSFIRARRGLADRLAELEA